MIELLGRFEGEKVIVLGSGMSVLQHEPEELQEFKLIGCNQIAKYVMPDVTTMIDLPFALRAQAGLEAPKMSLRNSWCLVRDAYCEEWFKVLPPILWAHRAQVFKWCHKFLFREHWANYYPADYESLKKAWEDGKCWMPDAVTSTGIAALLAIYTGASEVGILGLDYTKGYFWKPSHVFSSKPSTIRACSARWERKNWMTQKVFGVPMWNLSRQSLMKGLPYRSLETFRDS